MKPQGPQNFSAPEAREEILVVDDEESVRAVCQRTLSKLGFAVHTAEDGERALAHLESHDVAFVLTDLTMPGRVDGARLVEEIRRRFPSTDVALMTAFPSLETAIPVLKHGACDYLIKPFDQELLRGLVARHFEKRRLSRELDRERALRRELQEAYRELQKVERLKESFLGRVNHELRTPLLPALFALEGIEPDISSERGKRSFQALRSNLRLLRDTIENLLLFSELQKESPDFYRTSVDVDKLLELIVRAYKPEWEGRGLTIEVILDKGSRILWASPKLLETAFKHLFLNAVLFNKQGGKVRIEGRAEGEGVALTFSDTGAGIPADKLSRVFDSFYQAAEYLTRRVGGLGLGLAMVRRIVEMHGGEVSVQSREGEGSRFRVVLPKRDPVMQRAIQTIREASGETDGR